MTDDYTPTTDEVKAAYRQEFTTSDDVIEVPENDVEFDRWLQGELARAWDESKDAWVDFYENPALPAPENPYRKATDDE